jgi:hypothetical protein
MNAVIAPTSLQCRLLDACIICYDIQNGTIDPGVQYYADVGFKPGTAPAVFDDGPELINAGFVGETFDDWVIVAYRGTIPPFTGNFWSWVCDWLNDFRLGPMDWVVGGKTIGKVETGFGSAVLNTWPAVTAALAKIDLTQKKGILVTGHSKGGGMAFPAATLLKNLYPTIPVQNCGFAPPLTCDSTFAANYTNMGLDPFTVRYQNQYDIVPFLPYYPHFALLAAAERRSNNGVNTVITPENWPSGVENDYVRIGKLRYLGDGCKVVTGTQGQDDADTDIWHALEHLEFETIAAAHAARGRYHTCVCGS